ncbi:PREDICTED: mechanosensitive ion channel protein 8-like [Nicotiana attenuata]|uniref:Mechanosensitive ion channel protein n=1 Tax=Nicotiana attenuata TaxID=49451 RepID=A0A1J6J755_NICAT|nr:PREDICTED: mechanosensitive ion channel protein 8-like [Nicotiana attenuata]OIT08472.1 mechanosensitive ion channel protein 8 [Nicotiana attenuata]
MGTFEPKDSIVKINSKESPKTPKETEMSFSSKPHFNKNDSNNSNKDLNIVNESPVSQHSPLHMAQEEALHCSSISSLRKKSSLLVSRTKSRLLDPQPPEQDQRSQNVAMKSGALLRDSEIEEDDAFSDEDLPEEYKKLKFSPLTVLQLVSLVVIIAALVCGVIFKVLREKKGFGLELWKWEVMILVLICGRLVSGWGIRLVVFLIECNFLLRKRVLYFVYGLRNSVQNCIWLSLVLIAWQCIFDKKVDKMTGGKVLPYVSSIWVCLLVGAYIWLLKTLLVKVLAMSFHVSTFFDRIQESLFNQYVIETLSGPPLVEIDQQEEEEKVMAEVQKLQSAGATLPADLKASIFAKRPIGTPRKTPTSTPRSSAFSRVISEKVKEEEGGITIDHLHRLNQKNISAWNMKRLINMVRNGVLSTLDEKLPQSTHEDESAVQITSEKKAKAAAKKIFSNVAKPGSKFIYLEDLMRFMREDEAVKTMRLIEGGTETSGISKGALKNWVVNAFRERRALALSLNDTKTAVNKLHQILNVLVAIIILVIWLLILRVATTHFLVFLSSQMLLVVFIFGNSAKTTFEAIIFLFVMHPFDVGDRVEVDGVQLVVEEMNILTTVFLRYDNQKIIYPNSVLSTKPISNYYRSPDMGDSVDFCIHISTPMEKIAMMKERITRYIENRSDHWHPAPIIVMRDVENLNGIKWSVWPSHTMNHQDMGERWARRALLLEEMVKIFRELDIQYRMLPLDVNISTLPPLSSSRAPSNWSLCA